MPDDRDVNVLVPVSHETSARERLSESRTGARLTKALLPYERVRVTLVRDHPEGIHPLTYDEHGKPIVRLAPRGRHTAIVLVDKLDSAVLRAVRYPLTLGATEVWAVHAAVDPDRAGALVRKWMDARMPVPLDVIECWDRNVTRALEEYVLSRSDPGTEVTVVMARRDFPKLRQRLLHDRTSTKIMRTLGRYPHVDIARVPYYFAPRPAAEPAVPAVADVR
jgi:YD repeat-containing protein